MFWLSICLVQLCSLYMFLLNFNAQIILKFKNNKIFLWICIITIWHHRKYQSMLKWLAWLLVLLFVFCSFMIYSFKSLTSIRLLGYWWLLISSLGYWNLCSASSFFFFFETVVIVTLSIQTNTFDLILNRWLWRCQSKICHDSLWSIITEC